MRELDEKTAEKIFEGVRKGAHSHVAAAAAGVMRSTFDSWKGRAEAGDEYYASLFANLELAEATLEAELVEVIHKAARGGDTGAAAWLAERRFGDR